MPPLCKQEVTGSIPVGSSYRPSCNTATFDSRGMRFAARVVRSSPCLLILSWPSHCPTVVVNLAATWTVSTTSRQSIAAGALSETSRGW